MSYNEELESRNAVLRAILEKIGLLPSDAVRYTVAQTLTAAQQAQAQQNIGLGEEFKAEIVAAVLAELGGVTAYVDKSTMRIILDGVPEGEYTFWMKLEDGSLAEIGKGEEDSTTYYTVTNNLTNCTSSNSATQVAAGESYTATITAASGYELESVAATMDGGSPLINGNTISIASVTGNIEITAVAVEATTEPSYTNLLPQAVDADGSPYNGGTGYKAGYKMSTSSGNESATSGAYCSGFMPVNDIYDRIRVKNITLSDAANVNNFVFYDASKTKIAGSTSNGTAGAFHVYVIDEGNGVYHTDPSAYLSADKSIAFFRFSCGGISDATIVTVNEEIV